VKDLTLEFSWTEDDELVITALSSDLEEIEDQYVIEEEQAYELFLLLERKFQKFKRIVKVPVKSDDNSSNSKD
jgi:hypothetical protein